MNIIETYEVVVDTTKEEVTIGVMEVAGDTPLYKAFVQVGGAYD